MNKTYKINKMESLRTVIQNKKEQTMMTQMMKIKIKTRMSKKKLKINYEII